MPLLIYDFATAPLWFSLKRRKIFLFFFISACAFIHVDIELLSIYALCEYTVQYVFVMLPSQQFVMQPDLPLGIIHME